MVRKNQSFFLLHPGTCTYYEDKTQAAIHAIHSDGK
jgi:hypothetical protein